MESPFQDEKKSVFEHLKKIHQEILKETTQIHSLFKVAKKETKEIEKISIREDQDEGSPGNSKTLSKTKSIISWARKNVYEIQDCRRYIFENLLAASLKFQKSHKWLNLTNLSASILTGILDVSTRNWGAFGLSLISLALETLILHRHRGGKPLTNRFFFSLPFKFDHRIRSYPLFYLLLG